LSNSFFKPIKKVSVSESENLILSGLEDIENQLKSTQKAITDLKRELPFYFSKALREYYKRGFPL
jgi:predicted DNA-binding antitoxin AbrB/MazE fold protein